MPETQGVNYDSLEKYRRNVGKAQVADLMAKMTGANVDLVSYDEVAKRIRARQQIEMGTQMVPLSKIVGSVGRYRDFTRTFLPRAGVNPERWARIDAVMHSMEGFPPIEVYKIGDVYFVRDGNHRVSVARANGLTHIEAYVTEIPTDVPLHMEDFERDQWLIKIERTEFLKETQLDVIRPGHGIELTEPGRYQILLRHIQVHQYLRNLDLEREGSDHRLTWEEAVASWYDNVYLPMVEAIRSHDLMSSFPKRTEADLYLWIAFHREQLATSYGLAPLSPDAAVATFAEVHSERPWEQAVRTLKFEWHRVLGDLDKPLGMSEEEFIESRARHAAGERTLAEAENEEQVQQEQFGLAVEERELAPVDSATDLFNIAA
ncbi:MAG TPA: hypothetical protein DCL15_15285 [Chloroflexi bacterium]|nr:hypothetical protein [Chloroflexota bacterium]HHW86136.1 hypothetical protein [Chloroflexota bacterium]